MSLGLQEWIIIALGLSNTLGLAIWLGVVVSKMDRKHKEEG